MSDGAGEGFPSPSACTKIASMIAPAPGLRPTALCVMAEEELARTGAAAGVRLKAWFRPKAEADENGMLK